MQHIATPVVGYHIQYGIADDVVILAFYITIAAVSRRIILLAFLALIWFHIFYIEAALAQVFRTVAHTAARIKNTSILADMSLYPVANMSVGLTSSGYLGRVFAAVRSRSFKPIRVFCIYLPTRAVQVILFARLGILVRRMGFFYSKYSSYICL